MSTRRASDGRTARQTPPCSSARRTVFALVVVAAGLVLVMSGIDAVTATPPPEGVGWIGGPIEAVFAGGPLVAVAFGLRSRRRDVARCTAVAALALACIVAFVFTKQLLDPGETTFDRTVEGVGVLIYLAVFLVEMPAFTAGWPASDTTAR